MRKIQHDRTVPLCSLCGEYYDDESGLIYLRNRYYDSSIGRFITEDPIRDGLNWYVYCGNNPVMYVDPWGLDDETIEILKCLSNLKKNYQEFGISVEAAAKKGDEYREKIKQSPMMEKAVFYSLVESAFGDGRQGSIQQVEDLIYVAIAITALEKIANDQDDELTHEQHEWLHSSDAVHNSCVYQISVSDMQEICFVAGTKILTDNGHVDIETISVGDYVYSKNEHTGEEGYKQVTRIFRNSSKEIIRIHIDGETIETTPTHPFYVVNKGWTMAKDLSADDVLYSNDKSSIIVQKIEYITLDDEIYVYNFEVEQWHTYFVANLSIWVHNKCDPGYAQVYFGIDASGVAIYVGISNDINTRTRQHGERFPGGLVPITPPIPRFSARSIEQGLIEKNPQFENIINSISPKNPLYEKSKMIYGVWDEENYDKIRR